VAQQKAVSRHQPDGGAAFYFPKDTMKSFRALLQKAKNWFRRTFSPKQADVSVAVDSRDLISAEFEQPSIVARVSDIESDPELTGHAISGNAGIASANVLLAGLVSKAVVADAEGFYSFSGFPDGAYVVRPSIPTPGKTFSPEIQVVVVAGADVFGVDFIDPSSPVDSRATTATTPNSSRNVQGSLIYDVQKVESRAAGAPADCRVAPNIPVDSRVSPNIPQNSRA
jgi:hypothetical protein